MLGAVLDFSRVFCRIVTTVCRGGVRRVQLIDNLHGPGVHYQQINAIAHGNIELTPPP